MINEIIAAISAALDAEFGDEYEIYMAEIKQDLKEPCFLCSASTRQRSCSGENDIFRAIHAVFSISRSQRKYSGSAMRLPSA